MDLVFCKEYKSVDCPNKNNCPFFYGVDFDHLGETFPVNILTDSDTASVFERDRAQLKRTFQRSCWQISCSRVFPFVKRSGIISMGKE